MLTDTKRKRGDVNQLQMFPETSECWKRTLSKAARSTWACPRQSGRETQQHNYCSWELTRVLERVGPGYLPSPSSTTAWITMGNTPRSRSKFNFKEKDRFHHVAQRQTAAHRQTRGGWGGCSRLPLSTRWSRFWRRAWRTAGSPPACSAPFQRPATGSSGCTCTHRTPESTPHMFCHQGNVPVLPCVMRGENLN